MQADYYYTIGNTGIAEYKDRGSRFIAYGFPIQSVAGFKSALQAIKDEHPKATHHCFAYRLRTDGNVFRVGDDGEPSGTAGRPILGQIDSRKLTNVLVVVVRYFGGTLLGVAGLINAYKTAAGMVLQVIPTVQKDIEASYRLQFDYTRLGEVMSTLKQFRCSILQQDIQLFCVLVISLPAVRKEALLHKLKQIDGLECLAEPEQPKT